MISLEEYKNELIAVYRYQIDNNEIKREYRKEYLAKNYSDEYLERIINNTYDVIKTFFDISKDGFCDIDMDEDTTTYISLDLSGGYFSDRLYIDSLGNVISEHILKRTFGNRLDVRVKVEEKDFDSDDPDIVSFDYIYSLYLQGFPDNMEEIKESLFGVSRGIKKKEK